MKNINRRFMNFDWKKIITNTESTVQTLLNAAGELNKVKSVQLSLTKGGAIVSK